MIQIGGMVAFYDGVDTSHKCNSDGDITYTTASGKRVTWNTHRSWANMTTMARQPLIFSHYEGLDDPIVSASVSCSICKSVLIDEAAWMEV